MPDSTITSLSNTEVKLAASLQHRKYRKLYGYYLAEGVRLVLDTIKAGGILKTLFLSDDIDCALSSDTASNLHSSPRIDELCSIVPAECVRRVTAAVMRKICATDSPQGVAAIFTIPQSQQPFGGDAVILDNISDPGNAGTIVRTAAACGVKHILTLGGADLYSPKCVRSAMGALNFVNVCEYDSAREALKAAGGRVVICADMHGINLFDNDYFADTSVASRGFALVVGSEAEGVDKQFLAGAETTLRLPMQNIESLNAAVAASVMLYYLRHNLFRA